MASDTSEFKLSSLTLSVYIPTILFSIGQGAVIPVIPLFARELGSSVAAASLIVALKAIGQLVFDMPAGVAVSKWGDKGAMVAGTAMVATVAIGASVSNSPLVLAICIFFMGGGWAFWQLARLSYVTEVAPLHQRGRALSMLGGMNRVGNFIGPIVGGFAGQYFGLESAFIGQAIFGLLSSAMMFAVVRTSSGSEEMGGHNVIGRLTGTMAENKHTFATAGPPVMALSILRQGRQAFLPLWGEHIGLDVAAIGVVTSISFFADAAVFYPVGAIMDKWGRKWAAVPCLITLAIGFTIWPATHDIYTFAIVSLITGVGNGFGAGIVMTLGADFAPDVGRGEFLGVWRLLSDAGGAAGPVVISALIATLGSLAIASLATAGIGFAGAAAMMAFVPEPLHRNRKVIETDIELPETTGSPAG